MNSIYTGKTIIIPLADIQHCIRLVRNPYGAVPSEKGPQPNGLHVITSKTTYNREVDDWENAAYVPENETEAFLAAWHAYRERLETPMMVIDPGLRTDRPGLPELVPHDKEARWRIRNSLSSVVDEFTCKGGPLLHYSVKAGLSYAKVVELGYRAEEVVG